jgi:hypothetical protein
MLAMENIANSDAAYHDMNHTVMVTLVGQESINDLLQPQAHLCSMGADRRLHGDEIVRLTKWAREQVNISSNRLALLPPNALFRANAVPDDAGFGAEE